MSVQTSSSRPYATRGETTIRARRPLIHSAIVRVTHWVNAAAMIVLIRSGWQIHNAYPTLPFLYPDAVTIGGGLAGALRWHFATMWILVGNGIIYLIYGLASGRFRRKFIPLSLKAFLADARAALRGRLVHQDLSIYNAVQRCLYVGVIVTAVLIVVTGFAIWKPVQFELLTRLFGDFDMARFIHFLAMQMIVGFLIIHIAMSLLVPSSLRAMLFGR